MTRAMAERPELVVVGLPRDKSAEILRHLRRQRGVSGIYRVRCASDDEEAQITIAPAAGTIVLLMILPGGERALMQWRECVDAAIYCPLSAAPAMGLVGEFAHQLAEQRVAPGHPGGCLWFGPGVHGGRVLSAHIEGELRNSA